MDNKEELLRKLKKGEVILTEWEKDKDMLVYLNRTTGIFTFLFFSAILYILFYVIFQWYWIVSIFIGIVIASVYHFFTWKKRKEKKLNLNLQERMLHAEWQFTHVTDLDFKYYSLSKVRHLIIALESGEADTLKEALAVARQKEQHQLYMDATEALVKENKKLKEDVKRLNSEVYWRKK